MSLILKQHDIKVKITEFRVNDVQLKFGKDKNEPGFFIDGNEHGCDSKMKTAYVGIQNEEVVSSICINSDDEKEHIKHNQEIRDKDLNSRLLSLGYKLSEQNWSDGILKVYYKVSDRFITFEEAKQKCRNDGTSFPAPRSGSLYLNNQKFNHVTT